MEEDIIIIITYYLFHPPPPTTTDLPRVLDGGGTLLNADGHPGTIALQGSHTLMH